MVRLWAVITALLPLTGYATLSLRSRKSAQNWGEWAFDKAGVHFDGSKETTTLKFPEVVHQTNLEKQYQTLPAAAEYGNYNGDRPLHYAPPDCYPGDNPGLYTGFENGGSDWACASWSSHWNIKLDVQKSTEKTEDGLDKTNDGTGGLAFKFSDANDEASAYIAANVPTFGISSMILGISGSGVGNHPFCRFPELTPKPADVDCNDHATQKDFGESKELCESQKAAYKAVTDAKKPWCLACTGTAAQCAFDKDNLSYDAKHFAPKTCDSPVLLKCQEIFETKNVDNSQNLLTAWIHSGYPGQYIYGRRQLKDANGTPLPLARQFLGADASGTPQEPKTGCIEAYKFPWNIEDLRETSSTFKGKQCRKSIGKLYDNGQNYEIGMESATKADFEGDAHLKKIAEVVAKKEELEAKKAAIQADINAGKETKSGTLAYQLEVTEKKITELPTIDDDYKAWSASPNDQEVPEHYATWCHNRCLKESGAKYFSLTAETCGCYRSCDPVAWEVVDDKEVPAIIYRVENKWAVA